jgi:hypothetical protein
VENVKSSVANDETGFKVFNFEGPIRKLEKKVSRQPTGKRETKM